MTIATINFIAQQADQCVKCGLCLPHCPTYQLTHHEGHSPRGRIVLMGAIATGQATADATAQDYLDHCLACGACEAVCPAKVQYGAMLSATREVLSLPYLSTNKIYNTKTILK